MTALVLYYMTTADAYGAPMLVPFSPLVKRDLKDSLLKTSMYGLRKRPKVFRTKNETRLNAEKEETHGQD